MSLHMRPRPGDQQVFMIEQVEAAGFSWLDVLVVKNPQAPTAIMKNRYHVTVTGGHIIVVGWVDNYVHLNYEKTPFKGELLPDEKAAQPPHVTDACSFVEVRTQDLVHYLRQLGKHLHDLSIFKSPTPEPCEATPVTV